MVDGVYEQDTILFYNLPCATMQKWVKSNYPQRSDNAWSRGIRALDQRLAEKVLTWDQAQRAIMRYSDSCHRQGIIGQNTVMMLTTSITTTTGVLTVLPNTSVTTGNMPSLLSCLVCPSWHSSVE